MAVLVGTLVGALIVTFLLSRVLKKYVFKEATEPESLGCRGYPNRKTLNDRSLEVL